MAELKRILSTGADPSGREDVAVSLGELPVELVEAASGAEAVEYALRARPDLVLIDTALQDITALGFCRLLREHPRLRDLPVVLVSSFASEIDRILAFETGVDDFLAKPFYRRELASRVSAVLRRSGGPAVPEPASAIQANPVRIDPTRTLVEVQGRRVHLTPKEFEILGVLVRNEGRVVSRDRILSEVWGPYPAEKARVVDAHIKSIRRKLGAASDNVQTVRGIGFRFSPGRRDGPLRAERAARGEVRPARPTPLPSAATR